MTERTSFTPTTAEDVTDEILDLVWQVVDGWYQASPVDWDDVWDRVEGSELADGRELLIGEDLATPAVQKIKRVIRMWRRNS